MQNCSQESFLASSIVYQQTALHGFICVCVCVLSPHIVSFRVTFHHVILGLIAEFFFLNKFLHFELLLSVDYREEYQK